MQYCFEFVTNPSVWGRDLGESITYTGEWGTNVDESGTDTGESGTYFDEWGTYNGAGAMFSSQSLTLIDEWGMCVDECERYLGGFVTELLCLEARGDDLLRLGLVEGVEDAEAVFDDGVVGELV